jgi:polyphenol oxidase
MRAGFVRTRREFLRLGVGAGLASCVAWRGTPLFAQQGSPLNCAPVNPPATATPFSPDAGLSIRVRKSAFDLNQDEIDRLKAAFGALRTLSETDPLDPRGWLNQAHVHCWYCGGPRGDGTGAGPEIHGTWNFMPWHRAYLYFLERILAKLIEDDTFALPYWDWDTVRMQAERATLPHAAMPLPYIHPNGPTNPLRDELRLAAASERIPAAFVGPTMMDPIMQNANTDLFFGTRPGSATPVDSMVEFGPHGVVHLWVGDPLMRDPVGTPDMGVLATAAQDPIFFAHHANIDRLWVRWLAQGGGRANPISQDWLNASWTFFDENGEWVSIKASDVVEHEGDLRYQYEPPAGLVAITTTTVGAGPAATGEISAAPAPVELATAGDQLRLGPDPLTRSVALAEEERSRLLGPGVPSRTPVIRIAGVRAPVGGAAIVRVFVNLPSADVTTPVTDPHYVGYFTLVPNSLRGAHAHGQAGLNIELPLSQQTRQIAGGDQELSVTLVPVTADESAPVNISLTIEAISLMTR